MKGENQKIYRIRILYYSYNFLTDYFPSFQMICNSEMTSKEVSQFIVIPVTRLHPMRQVGWAFFFLGFLGRTKVHRVYHNDINIYKRVNLCIFMGIPIRNNKLIPIFLQPPILKQPCNMPGNGLPGNVQVRSCSNITCTRVLPEEL